MRLIDLSGQHIEHFLVLERDFETQKIKQDKEVFWKCQCDCGTIFSVRGHDIRDRKIKSCGCWRKKVSRERNFIDLTGETFGKLKVLYEEPNIRADAHSVWVCQCDCGNIVNVSGRNFRKRTTQSCGCLKSQGELRVSSILQNLNINFISQYSAIDCRDQLPLKFDFFLPAYNVIIEYQGEQHYYPLDFMGGEERFQDQQRHDNIKREWCKKHNILLIEIPYTDFLILDNNYILTKLNKGEQYG